MAEKKSLSLSLNPLALKRGLDQLLAPVRKHSAFILVLVSLSMVTYSVIMISSTLQRSDDEAYRNQQAADRIKSSFDKDTIKKVDNLRNSTDSSSIDLPGGRRDPFTN